jgi:dipeptidyl aminopeptidase/acylaminoacyl peptidase
MLAPILGLVACHEVTKQDLSELYQLASVESAGRLPIKAFAALPRLEEVSLSPSGNYLAFLENHEDLTIVGTQAVDGQDLHILLKADNKVSRITGFRWINDERLLISTSHGNSRGGYRTTETRLIAVDRQGTNLDQDLLDLRPDSLRLRRNSPSLSEYRYLPQFQDRVLDIIPGDTRHVLIELNSRNHHHPDVYKLDVYTGNLELVQRHLLGVNSWMADKAGAIRLGSGIQETKFETMVKASGSWRTISSFDIKEEPGLRPLGFDYDPMMLFLRGSHQGREAVFRLDLSHVDARPELVASDPEDDVRGRLIYFPWLKKAVGAFYSTDEPALMMYWNQEARAFQDRIDRALPNRTNALKYSTSDGRRHLIWSVGSTQPPQAYVLDEATHRLLFIGDSYPMLKPAQLVKPDVITFSARDGTELRGYLTLPKGHERERVPLVLFPHRLYNASNGQLFDLWTQFFVSRGWAVLQVNFRGSVGKGRAFQEAGFGKWGIEIQTDLEDGVHFVISKGIVNSNRVCIVGKETGGYASLMATVKTPDLFRCAISFGGIADLRDFLLEKRAFEHYNILWERQVGQYWGDRSKLMETSPVNHAEKIRTPLLIMHGAEDRRVPVEQSRGMASALEKAGFKDFRYVELPLGDDRLSREEDRLRVFLEMEAFLKQHLD